MKQESWEPCPRCRSTEVRVLKNLPAASFMLVLGATFLVISQRYINRLAGVHEFKYICKTCKFKFNPSVSQEFELQQQP